MEIMDDSRFNFEIIPGARMPKSFLLSGKKRTLMDISYTKENEQDMYASEDSCLTSPVSNASNHSDDNQLDTSGGTDTCNSSFNQSERSAFSKIPKPDIGFFSGNPYSGNTSDFISGLSSRGFYPTPFLTGCLPLPTPLGYNNSPPPAHSQQAPFQLPKIQRTDNDSNEERESTSTDSNNMYYYVDPRIPFTNYFLNLTKLLSKSCSAKTPISKVGDELRTDDREEPMASPSSRKPENIKLEPSEEKLTYTPTRSPKRLREPIEEIHSKLTKTVDERDNISPPFASHPLSVSFGSPFIHPGQQMPLVPLPGAGIFHPALMPISAPGFRRFNPEKPPPVKKYKCDVCGKAFSRSNTLVTHKRIHTGDKPFKCEICGRAFRQPGNLTRHRLTHTTVKPYVCPTCNKAFNRASNLHTHMRTHTTFKPFVCPFCGKAFHQKIDMKIHCYTHTGECPHNCDTCGKGFTLSSTLNAHKRTHVSHSNKSATRIHSDIVPAGIISQK